MPTNIRIPQSGEVIPTLEGFVVQSCILQQALDDSGISYVLNLKLVTNRPIRLRELILGNVGTDDVTKDNQERAIVFED